jgi:hypothetical protein
LMQHQLQQQQQQQFLHQQQRYLMPHTSEVRFICSEIRYLSLCLMSSQALSSPATARAPYPTGESVTPLSLSLSPIPSLVCVCVCSSSLTCLRSPNL